MTPALARLARGRGSGSGVASDRPATAETCIPTSSGHPSTATTRAGSSGDALASAVGVSANGTRHPWLSVKHLHHRQRSTGRCRALRRSRASTSPPPSTPRPPRDGLDHTPMRGRNTRRRLTARSTLGLSSGTDRDAPAAVPRPFRCKAPPGFWPSVRPRGRRTTLGPDRL